MNYIAEAAQQIRDSVDPDKLPDGDIDDLFLIYALLALVKGMDVTRQDVHNAWAVWMTSRDPNHESIEPYSELSPGVRLEDQPFVDAIRKVASKLDTSQ
jgi:hypothetical protein